MFPPSLEKKVTEHFKMFIPDRYPNIAVAAATAAAAAKSLQSCPTLCDPIDGSPSGSPVPGSCDPQKSPDTPGSPEGNTEGPGTSSSEPLLPS